MNSKFFQAKDNTKCKLTSFVVTWLDTNHSIKSFYNIFTNNKSKTNTLSVHLSCILKSSKKLKKFDSILSFNPDSWIYHRYYNFISILNWLKNLLYSVFLFKFAQLAFFRIRITVIFTCCWKIEIFGNCLRFLWLHFRII